MGVAQGLPQRRALARRHAQHPPRLQGAPVCHRGLGRARSRIAASPRGVHSGTPARGRRALEVQRQHGVLAAASLELEAGARGGDGAGCGTAGRRTPPPTRPASGSAGTTPRRARGTGATGPRSRRSAAAHPRRGRTGSAPDRTRDRARPRAGRAERSAGGRRSSRAAAAASMLGEVLGTVPGGRAQEVPEELRVAAGALGDDLEHARRQGDAFSVAACARARVSSGVSGSGSIRSTAACAATPGPASRRVRASSHGASGTAAARAARSPAEAGST